MNDTSNSIVDGDLRLRNTYVTATKQQPLTVEHKPYTPKHVEQLINAGTARATLAVSTDSPNGTTKDGYAAKQQ